MRSADAIGNDSVGNRLSRLSTVLGTPTTDSYSYATTDNRLASISGGTARTFTYDAAGNVTFDNSTGAAYSYTYNAANRMESFAINGVVQAEFEYNPLGQQEVIRYTQTGQTVHVLFDLDGNRIAEYDFDAATNTSTLLRQYVWLDGAPVAVIENDVVYFVRSDHIGRPVFATDDTGAVVWTASYLPFGGVHASTGTPMELRFPGQWFQSESGLHQNWMRDYDPTTGRYIQADPLGLVDGASVYGYARQSPGRYVDPRGEVAFWVPGAVIGGVIGGVAAYNNSPECIGNIVIGAAAGAVVGAAGSYLKPAYAAGAGFGAAAAGQWAANGLAELTGNCECYTEKLMTTPGFWMSNALGGVAAGFGPIVGRAAGNAVYRSGPQFGGRLAARERVSLGAEAVFDGSIESLGSMVPN